MHRLSVWTTGCVLLLALVTAAPGQWIADAALNTPVCDAVGDTVQPKVAPAPDGGTYVSWFDNRDGGYDVYLQRITRDGVALWATNGILIADLANSSTQDYGLCADGAGGVYLAFLDTRFGGTVVTVTRVDQDGVQVWGSTGKQVSNGGSVGQPAVALSGDGRPVAAWVRDSVTEARRLEPDGTFAWPVPVTLSAPAAQLWVADAQSGDGTSVILSMVRQTGFAGAKTLWAQKLDASGASLWPRAHVKVFTAGSLQFGNFPNFLSDGAGGAVFAFYTTGPLQSWAQRVTADGSPAWGANGIAVTVTSAGRERTGPGFAFDPVTQRTYVAWEERIANTSQYGVTAQAFDAGGARLWGDDGTVIEPVVANFGTHDIEGEVFDGHATFAYVRDLAFNNGTLFAAQLDDSGALLLNSPLALSSTASGHSRVETIFNAGPWGASFVAIWQDSRDGDQNLYGQAMNPDGSLGPPERETIVGDLDGDGLVNATDLAILLGAWGSTKGSPADLDGNGAVDAADLAVLLGAWS
ncbi:MAG: dockerin type I domain-containing protein [Phycisphaerae bacterium]|nr:dockerin type I domain-containing protein [Phycisphaerae bacterium]